MIIGSVGSGKSSLVSAILGEMTTLSGTVQFYKFGHHVFALVVLENVSILVSNTPR